MQIDSPFYLRRPHDLEAFLRQSEYLQFIVIINAKLLIIKTELVEKMEQSNAYTIEFMYQTDCIINYFLQDTDVYSTVWKKKYLNRINSKKINKNPEEMETLRTAVPVCEDVSFSMTCMEHLESMMQRSRIEMQPEVVLAAKELGIAAASFAQMLVIGLKNEPYSWRYPLLSSYYWRSRGLAPRALACARRALLLAPRNYKDIPLLSIGTILQRANRSQDALVFIGAAADHAPNVAENHLALANAHFLNSDFNRSMECYANARRLDDYFAGHEEHMRKSMNCFKFIKTKLKQIEGQLTDMKADLVKFTHGKEYLDTCYEEMLREQVPINSRLLDPSFDLHSHHLLHREQYCSVRKTEHSGEPVLFCDFYSDLHRQLNKDKDSTIDTIQSYIDAKTEFIRNQWNLSLGVYKHLNIEQFDGDFDSKVDE